MTGSATRNSWKTLPPPAAREALGYQCVFSEAEMTVLRKGIIPMEMEDKWFIYFENGWLYLHRSWTGFLSFWLRFESCEDGMFVAESWVSRDPEQYGGCSVLTERDLLHRLLHHLMLGKDR